MKKIEVKDLIGEWRSYKHELKGIEKKSDGGNYIEWNFKENGKAEYTLLMENKTRTDFTERYWSIIEKEIKEQSKIYLCINENTEYEIVILDDEQLALKSQNEIIYYFTKGFNWYKIVGQ